MLSVQLKEWFALARELHRLAQSADNETDMKWARELLATMLAVAVAVSQKALVVILEDEIKSLWDQAGFIISDESEAQNLVLMWAEAVKADCELKDETAKLHYLRQDPHLTWLIDKVKERIQWHKAQLQ